MDENKTQQNNDKDVKVLRTYTSDMADIIRNNEVSVIKIAMAEKEKTDKENIYAKAKGTNLSKILMIAGGIILVATAIIGSSFLSQKKKVVPQPKINMIQTFISYDSKSEIDVTEVNNISDLSKTIKKNQRVNPGIIEAMFLTRNIDGTSGMLTSKDFLSLIQSTTPSPLVRSLSDKYLFGKYYNHNNTVAKNKNAIFLIFETTDYNQAYASMLEWEKTILEDLFVLIDVPKPSNSLLGKPWKDIIINNKDARVLYGEDGEAILYYAFVNKNNFVITNDLEALKEIIKRLLIKN